MKLLILTIVEEFDKEILRLFNQHLEFNNPTKVVVVPIENSYRSQSLKSNNYDK